MAVSYPRASIPQIFFRSPQKAFLGRNWRMAQSRRQVRPRNSHLVHSASFRARNPNKASMTLMLAAAMIWATDALERHLAPPGFQCCERDLLGRSKPRDLRRAQISIIFPVPENSGPGENYWDWMLGAHFLSLIHI